MVETWELPEEPGGCGRRRRELRARASKLFAEAVVVLLEQLDAHRPRHFVWPVGGVGLQVVQIVEETHEQSSHTSNIARFELFFDTLPPHPCVYSSAYSTLRNPSSDSGVYRS